MTIDSLKASKLGKIVVKLVKDPPTPGELISFLFSDPEVVKCACRSCCCRHVFEVDLCAPFTYPYRRFETRTVIYVSNSFFVFFLIVLRNAAIKDMAFNVERKWRQLVSVANDGDGESR